MSSKNVERQKQWNPCFSEISEDQLLIKPTKNPKPNRNEDPNQERGNTCHSDIPEWLQEFRENLWMTEFLNTKTHTPVFSHEASLELTLARSADLGKHSVYTNFPNDRNCEICQRTRITRAPCRRRIGGVVLRAKNFGDLITANHKVFSGGCESWNKHRCAIVVQNLASQWSSRIRAKHELLKKHKRACRSSWSRIRSLKSFTLTIPENLANRVEIFPGIIVRQHHTDRKQMGLLREQYAELKKVRLQYCCNQVFTKS